MTGENVKFQENNKALQANTDKLEATNNKVRTKRRRGFAARVGWDGSSLRVEDAIGNRGRDEIPMGWWWSNVDGAGMGGGWEVLVGVRCNWVCRSGE